MYREVTMIELTEVLRLRGEGRYYPRTSRLRRALDGQGRRPQLSGVVAATAGETQ